MTTTADTAELTTPEARLQAALADPNHLFTREQVVYLMHEAARWGREAVEDEPSELTYRAGVADGYRQRVREENANWPPPPIYAPGTLTRWIDQVDYRRKVTAEGRRRRRGDWRGTDNGGRLHGPWPAEWCGDYAAHDPHPVKPNPKARTEGFRCKGRKA